MFLIRHVRRVNDKTAGSGISWIRSFNQVNLNGARNSTSKYSTVSGNEKTMLLMDVDCGVDDAQSIMLALRNSSKSKLLAITCVNGNTSVKQVTKNVAYVLNICQRDDIPVFVGADHPLLVKNVHPAHFHGHDGLGDIDDRIDNHDFFTKVVQKEHAVDVIIDLVNQYKNQISLLALGPLTNIALACRLDSDLPNKVKDLTIMGGNYLGRGNIVPAAEFNFYADPEAVHIVFEEFPALCPTRLITWEAAIANALHWDWVLESWFKQGTPLSQLNVKLLAKIGEKHRNESPLGYTAPDPLATAIAIDPTIIKDSIQIGAKVELHGKFTRAQVVTDWYNHWNRSQLLNVVQKVDMERYKEMLWNSTKAA